jgi:hypothetical protein
MVKASRNQALVTGVPQSRQNFAPAGSWAEHLPHFGFKAPPQPMQKAAVAGEATWQAGHAMVATAPRPPPQATQNFAPGGFEA